AAYKTSCPDCERALITPAIWPTEPPAFIPNQRVELIKSTLSESEVKAGIRGAFRRDVISRSADAAARRPATEARPTVSTSFTRPVRLAVTHLCPAVRMLTCRA